MMKKIGYILCIGLMLLTMTGCTQKNVEGTLPEIMEQLYKGIPEDELFMVHNVELTEENFEYYAFTKADYKEAIASEGTTAQAHSIVLIRLNDEKDAEKVVEEIEKNADPRKWMCVEAENKYVLSKGDLVVLIMSNELAPKIKSNFEKLK